TTHWRSHRHHREVLTGDVEDTSTAWGVTPQPGPEDVAVHRESATELSAYHNHIVARIAQIGTPAAVMGCGTGTVKSTTHRALTLLRAALTSEVTA
ncbi:MAG: RNA polymerase sigma factor, partial [Pseudonocardiaceae bacterium]